MEGAGSLGHWLSDAGATPCRSAGGSLHDIEASLGDSAGGNTGAALGSRCRREQLLAAHVRLKLPCGPGLSLPIRSCPSLRCRGASAAWAAFSSSPPRGRLAGFFAAPPSRASDQVVGNAGIWANVGCANHSWARPQLSSARTAGEPTEPRSKPIAVGRGPSPAGGLPAVAPTPAVPGHAVVRLRRFRRFGLLSSPQCLK